MAVATGPVIRRVLARCMKANRSRVALVTSRSGWKRCAKRSGMLRPSSCTSRRWMSCRASLLKCLKRCYVWRVSAALVKQSDDRCVPKRS